MIDRIQLEMICQAIDNAGAWIAFFFSLLGIVAAVILTALFAALILRSLCAATWNRFVVSLERKALR